MEQRVSVIMLGVADVRRARQFYQALGWRPAERGTDDVGGSGPVVHFQAGGLVFSLVDRASLVVRGVPDSGGGGISFAYVVDDPIDVDIVLAEARGGGAMITQPACRTDRGGYRGVFIDPDGHAWQVVYDPDWILRDDGSVSFQRGFIP